MQINFWQIKIYPSKYFFFLKTYEYLLFEYLSLQVKIDVV